MVVLKRNFLSQIAVAKSGSLPANPKDSHYKVDLSGLSQKKQRKKSINSVYLKSSINLHFFTFQITNARYHYRDDNNNLI